MTCQSCAKKDKALRQIHFAAELASGQSFPYERIVKIIDLADAALRPEALAKGKPSLKRCEFLLDGSDSICNAKLPCTEHS
jgi:hypothetical protein